METTIIISENEKMYQTPDASIIRAEIKGANVLIRPLEKKYNEYPVLLRFLEVNFATSATVDAVTP